jgi:hypothetical protein
MVRRLTPFKPFFAQEVQDLNGLDDNILQALRECVAFITVLHPRGAIARPDGPKLTRASVWIEQEIAIATYIQRTGTRSLPIIAFKHKSVGLEGIRTLLNLNPIEFTDEAEVLKELPKLLEKWNPITAADINLRLKSTPSPRRQPHPTSSIELILANDTTESIGDYEFELRVPAPLLKHWGNTNSIPGERRSDDSRYRRFRSDATRRYVIGPRENNFSLFQIEYCTKCAASGQGEVIDSMLIADAIVFGMAWIRGVEYKVQKTISELLLGAQ